MAKTVNMHDAKTHLSRLVQDLRDGRESEIVIAVSGKPYARLVPYAPGVRPSGMDAGVVIVADDFDSDDSAIAALFTGTD